MVSSQRMERIDLEEVWCTIIGIYEIVLDRRIVVVVWIRRLIATTARSRHHSSHDEAVLVSVVEWYTT